MSKKKSDSDYLDTLFLDGTAEQILAFCIQFKSAVGEGCRLIQEKSEQEN
jgi:hypothetical protein